MGVMTGFRAAVAEAAHGTGGRGTADWRDGPVLPRKVVLVEGTSDRVALETLAARRGRDLEADGVCVLPMGGATEAGRYVGLLGPAGLDVALAGLCDEAEERFFRRPLERFCGRGELDREALEELGFFTCSEDLEDELIRALGVDRVQEVLAVEGDLRAFRIFQRQPAQRARTVHRQLLRFLGTISGRKERYARSLTAALDPGRVPRPLGCLLDRC
ncbi:TOPRIM nucleotidyl transferase/hydrolase domain-containing protein [Arthrobacter sp.]|uniref:TOPRIM nucleotidyl transferase/hydrolase domain-containing protein n=1 Tax=Arthrobacter sp. TaxID=1667 RepID=UPI003A91AF5E